MNNTINWLIVWIGIAVCAAIIEGLTVTIVSCWFAVGAVFAVGAYLLGAPPLWQFIVFVIVSGLSLAIARPIIKKHNRASVQPTNADALIGQQAVVIEEISNLDEKGCVRIKGLEWSARSEDGRIIPKDSVVTIVKIEGVKLIVSQ